MAELACLTGRAGGAKELLPALEYLAHPVATMPLDATSLLAAAAKDLVVIDATRDLSRAQTICRHLRSGGDHLAILVVMPEAGLAGLQRDWGASDFVLPAAGPAEGSTKSEAPQSRVSPARPASGMTTRMARWSPPPRTWRQMAWARDRSRVASITTSSLAEAAAVLVSSRGSVATG